MVTEAASSLNAAAEDVARGYVGRIPVRNLWLLMLYASDLFRMCGRDDLACEDNPDELPNLVAEILTHAVEKRQRRRCQVTRRSPQSLATIMQWFERPVPVGELGV